MRYFIESMCRKEEWREYNERLVKRGEILIDIGFLEDIEEELEGAEGREERKAL